MDKQKKQDKKLYKKQNREFKKVIKQTLKHWGPWDYCYLLTFIEAFLKRTKQYYELGYNVCALDNEDDPTRLEVSTKALELLEHYYDVCSDIKWFQVEREDDALKAVFEYLGANIGYLWD